MKNTERTKNVIEDYDYEGGYVVVIYKLKSKFRNDFNLIKTGKYSKTSKEFQELFPKTVIISKNNREKEEISLQYRIFNKTDDLVRFWEEKFDVKFKDYWEVWEGFHEEKETLDINKIK